MSAPPIETVFLDAGGVLCHPSWTRVAAALVRHGADVTPAALAAAEQKATRDIDDAHTIGRTDDRARGWLYFNLVLRDAGTDAALAELRDYHRLDNLWEHVEPDVAPALAALKERGLTLVVVRCSGAVPSLLSALGDLLPLEVTGRGVKEGA